MTDEQFKTWAKSFLERTDTYSSWRGASVEAIQMIEDERARSTKLKDVLMNALDRMESCSSQIHSVDDIREALANVQNNDPRETR